MMVRHSFVALMMGFAIAGAAGAATEEERMAAVLNNAGAVVEQLGQVPSPEALAEADSRIERAWRDLVQYYGTGHPLAPQLALLRARSATERRDKSRSLEAWRTAMSLMVTASPAEQLQLNMEAGNAAAIAKDAGAAARYFAAARAYAFVRGNQAEMARLQMRVQELQQLGGAMSWRELRDALSDLREFSESFPMWTQPRLEALVAEAEIRLNFEPDDKEKREELSKLKADIILMQKGMKGHSSLTLYTPRIRTLFYALEDRFKL